MNKQNENNESVRRQLLALGQMTQEEMIEKWKDLFGVQPPQSRILEWVAISSSRGLS